MDHAQSSQPRQVRFQLLGKENNVSVLPPPRNQSPYCENRTQSIPPLPNNSNLTPHLSPASGTTSSAFKLLSNQFQNSCVVTTTITKPRASPVQPRDQDPVASILLQDPDSEMEDVVIMSGDLEEWPGLIRPVPTKLRQL